MLGATSLDNAGKENGVFSPEAEPLQRIASAMVAAVVQVAIVVALIWGLAGRGHTTQSRTPVLVAIPPATTAPRAVLPDRAEASRAEAAPPAPQSEPLPNAAYSPMLSLASPSPAATIAGEGTDASAGAALEGAGQGAGGIGAGRGSAGDGTQVGSGTASQPIRVAGALHDRDYPAQADRLGASGTVWIGFRVRADGRVDQCKIAQSSGFQVLDDLTCQLVEQRFVFRPAKDAQGRSVPATLRTSFTWGTRKRR